MDTETILLICSTILTSLIALINELMPFAKPVRAQVTSVPGEKGVITTSLVWVGVLKATEEPGDT